MRLSCCLILPSDVIQSETKNLEDIRMGKEFSKNIRFISTSGFRPHPRSYPLRVRRQAHSRRHHARRSPPVGPSRILCPFRYGQGSCHRHAQDRHRASEAARLDHVRHAFSNEGWGEGGVISEFQISVCFLCSFLLPPFYCFILSSWAKERISGTYGCK